MKRAPLSILAVLACACCTQPSKPTAGGGRGAEHLASPPVADKLVLHSGGMRVEFEMQLAPHHRDLLELSIHRIEQAEAGSFQLRCVASWIDSKGQQELELGRVTPFPSDRAGKFTLRPPRLLFTLLEAPPAKLSFHLELMTIDGRELPQGLRLELETPVFK